MRQAFKPAQGKIAVVVEGVAAEWNKELGIAKSEDTIRYEKAVNPWALVVGVGAPRITESGRLVKSEHEEGERVAISQVGRTLPLTTADGQTDYIYVLPFEGILGRVERVCDECGFKSTADIDNMECPKCPKIERATLLDLARMEQ